MMHDAFHIFLWLLAVPLGLFTIAFLAALADCTYATLFAAPVPASLDDMF